MTLTEKKLKESEERFKALFKSSPIPTYAWQKVADTFELIDYNNAAEDITQGNVKMYLGAKASEMYRDRPGILENLRRCLKEKKNITHETKYKMQSSKDEKDLIVKYIYVPPDLVLVHTEDITDRKNAQQELKVSEEKYRKLFSNAPFAIVLFNIEGTILDCNDATKLITGYSKEELIGKNYRSFNFYIDTNSANIEERQSQTYSGKTPKAREILLYQKDGSQFWARSQIEFIHMKDSNYIQAIIYDITEKKKAEQKLKESEEKFRNIAEQSLMGINVIQDGVFKYLNARTAEVNGYPLDELKNWNSNEFAKIIHPEDREFVMEQARKKQAGDPDIVNQYSFRIIRKDGEIRWLEIFSKTINFEGRPADLVMTVDTTDKKEAELKLKESEKKYHEAYDRGNFYKDLFAHDINNILQVISSSAELISLQLDDSEKSKDIEGIAKIIRKHVQKGAKLVNNVHTLTEFENGDQIIEPIEVISVLKNSIKFLQSAYSEKNIEIKIDAFANIISVQANELLQQIFDNLLINAVKYNENSNVDIQIKITKEQSETQNLIKMEFLDNGIGIRDDKKKILFKEGFRTLKGSKGMGLGLSLVNKIINNYNGKIWVEDKVKGDYTKGSNFVLLLPE